MNQRKRSASGNWIGVMLLASFLLSACAPNPIKAPAEKLKLYVMDCGTVDVSDVSVFSPGVNKGQRKVLTDSCYLIVHKNGTLLWDTGLPDALALEPNGKTIKVFTVKVKKPLLGQLAALGYTPDKIDYVGLSHMHFDHVGNANAFAKSTVLMQQEEYDAAFGATPDKFGFDPSTYENLRASKFIKLRGDYDVFGDGSVMIKRSIGHTPGHQALFVDLPKTGAILLSGDLVHFTDNWTHKRVPSFNFDEKLSIQAMTDMETFLKEKKATLWIQHDLEQNATIRHAPAYYD